MNNSIKNIQNMVSLCSHAQHNDKHGIQNAHN